MKQNSSFIQRYSIYKVFKDAFLIYQSKSESYKVTFLLLLVSSLPFGIYLVHTVANGTFLTNMILSLMGTISGTHVFATLYLYFSDRNISKGVYKPKLTLIIIPLCIIIFTILAAMTFSMNYLLIFMIFYVHYAIVHFGRQNLGIFSFFTLSELGRPLNKTEKLLINSMVICGLFGAMKIFSPNYMLDPNLFAINSDRFNDYADFTHDIGKKLYLILIIFSGYYLFLNKKNFSLMTASMFVICILWFFPIFYLFEYPLLSFASWTVSHGFQYLVILFSHSLNLVDKERSIENFSLQNLDEKKSKMIRYIISITPFIFLLFIMFIGKEIWVNQPLLFSGLDVIFKNIEENSILKLGFGLILGITLAHYFVDQFLWRLKDPEKRHWFKSRFPYISNK